ncbi:GSCFA domain-containing protein [Flagellimonas meridianipacifica]|uniref:GSCFA family protein n=1 Tax=Flagellimonas meridianipacifica TaxID=1080225 RepID=A0A2T0MES3_9FLAO|nr:GSCFA domain-containing protein [Allomuricauda pacifica]PRX56063.1 GSCFA family protein [Allomuricauda pacifica]
MKLQTSVPLSKAQNPIDYASTVLLIGSCFSENIGNKFSYYKFQVAQNPFGILFHPLAIENLITRALNSEKYDASDIFEFQERWLTFDAHSSMARHSREDLINTLNNALLKTKTLLEKASHVVITLGTAWVYHHVGRDVVVANCHKVPQKEFEKKLLGIDEIVASLHRTIQLIHSKAKNAECILTISPVRHLKDGFVENQLSKAHLIAAIHQLQNDKVTYFPSYEMVMDELRDYRFYDSDMVHPNKLAIDYIWERFKTVWISEKAYDVMDEVEAIQKGLSHKPFNSNSEAHKSFEKNLQVKIEYLQKNYPTINFDT